MRGIRLFVTKQRVAFAKRELESELATVITLMEGHKAASLPTGHRYYKLLETRSNNAITRYQEACVELGVPRPDYDYIQSGAPALRELHVLALGSQTKNLSPVVFGGCIATVVGGFIITIMIACYHDLYLYLTHWVH